MFPHPDTLIQNATLRFEAFQKEAARVRLADQAQTGRRSLPSLFAVQSLLGTALVRAGERLQGAPGLAALAQPR